MIFWDHISSSPSLTSFVLSPPYLFTYRLVLSSPQLGPTLSGSWPPPHPSSPQAIKESPVTAIQGENERIWEGNLCTNGKVQTRLSGLLLSSKSTQRHLTVASWGHHFVCCWAQRGWEEWWGLGGRVYGYKRAAAQRGIWQCRRLRQHQRLCPEQVQLIVLFKFYSKD